MLDQSFSAKNLLKTFSILNRVGKVDIDLMPENYRKCVVELKELRIELNNILKIKSSERSEADKSRISECQDLEKEKVALKEQVIYESMELLEEFVNSHEFQFIINKKTGKDGKDLYILENSLANLLVIRQLIYNLKKTHKIEMTSRHAIMTSLKSIFESKLKFFLIRTDIDSFFESIPQHKLLARLENNGLLSHRSLSMIKGILKSYNSLKSDPENTLGVPRGIGISSMLSEIYLQDFDAKIKGRREVVYYARYVDDIIIVLSDLGLHENIEDYYQTLSNDLFTSGLKLKSQGDKKCQLCKIDEDVSFTYLGYEIVISYDNKKKRCVTFDMSSKRKEKFKNRINLAFNHFTVLSKYNLHKALRDLFDSLHFICGNYRLANAKSRVKAGIFFNNDLLTKTDTLVELTQYLHEHKIDVYANLFKEKADLNQFLSRLKLLIGKIDITENWKEKKIYKFNDKRLSELASWL